MRDRGTFNFSGNLEVKKDAPLEARSLVNSYADLVKPETWTDEQGGIWKYDCMLVSCKDRPGEVYQLQPGADYTKQSSWILIGDTSELNSKVQQFINSKGAPNGLASLNESGIIPSAQLPSYVDDVIEVDTFSNLPGTGESGKIYIVQDTNLTYRWSGTDYVEISKSLALGETSSTAYPGDKGKATTDVVNSLSDNLVNDVLVSQSDKNSVSLTIKSITKNPVKKNKELLLVDGEPILLTDNTPILLADNVNDSLYDQADDKLITINQASSFTAGVMSASDKTKLDGLKAQAEIDTSISNVQNNLNAHINNRTNPHRVTKEQIGLDQVDNTSDANKPISNATQTALNGKFSATDGNALKQRVDNIPEWVATDITVDSDNDSVNISLDKTSIVDGTLSGTTININSATASKAGILVPTDKSKIDKIVTDGDGNKYLTDNGNYQELIEDTTETIKTTDAIPVAGGPLADLLNKAGINSISPDTSMQDLFVSLFTKELWPTNLVFKEGTVSAAIAAPSFTLSNTGLVEVGATVTIGKTTLSAATMSTTARTYSGFTYGYSSTNDNTKDSSNTTITVNASNAALNSVNYTMKRTTNGSVENATANTNPAQVTLDSKTFKAIEGTNTVKVDITGPTANATFASMPVYYACSNLGKTSEEHKSVAKDTITKTSSTPSNSKTLNVTGVYPYYTNKDNITTFAKLGLTTNKTLDVTFVAETASNKHAFKIPAKFNVTKITLLNTLSGKYEDYSVSRFSVTTETINVQGTDVQYKVYTRNDGTNGSSSFKITFA